MSLRLLPFVMSSALFLIPIGQVSGGGFPVKTCTGEIKDAQMNRLVEDLSLRNELDLFSKVESHTGAISISQLPAEFDEVIQPSAMAVVTGMLDAIKNTRQLSYKIKAWERFGKDMYYTESDVRMQTAPFKVYMKTWAPDAGIEILYEEGKRDGKALIKPNGFPYVNVQLDPYSSRMREGQHHTLLEAGFLYFGDIISRSLEQHMGDLDQYVTLEEAASWQGKPCFMLTIDHPGYHWVAYTVKSGENILDIARRIGVPEHSILERNPNLKDYQSVKSGQVINIPDTYSKKTELYIDKASLLPVKKLIYDDRGLYERYEFHYLNSKPGFTEKTFNSENPDYGF